MKHSTSKNEEKKKEKQKAIIEAHHKYIDLVETLINRAQISIKTLEFYGIDRFLDHGIDGFKRYVSLAVLARNLQVLGAKIRNQELEKIKRLKKRLAA